MCGLAGILALDARNKPEHTELRKMIGTLRHRGPDGFGFHQEGPVGLSHARLRIIDLATGDQPMANEDRTVWVVFNGEIFNYLELREELERAGHIFRTRSDTETIVHAYEEYGDQFVRHLNGQFAIALWDGRRGRLLLARDRVGIRPLFVQRDGDRWLFGSEVKAILVASRQPRQLDLHGLAHVFTFWGVVGDRTVFRGIRSIPPGCMLILEDGREILTRYWQWEFPQRGMHQDMSFVAAAAEVRQRLTDAVRLQLRADVPVGAYLSGGLDSSLIAALIREHRDVPLRTFSVVFDDVEFDESGFQEAMVRHLGTEHSAVRCTQHDIGAAFRRLIEHTETPVLRTAPVPLMLLSEHVRKSGFRVVLTGEGADEVFGGYDLFKEALIRRFWARQPASRCRPALLSRLYPYLRHSPVGQKAYAQSFFGHGLEDVTATSYAHAQRWSTTRRVLGFLSDDGRAAVADVDVEADLERELPASFGDWAGLSRDQFVEATTLLSGYLLSSQGDRVAMANSVEGRVPFLDHNVIEFANSLPPRFKMRGLNEKAVLRAAAKDLLPPSICDRPKQPYRAPDNQSFFKGGPGEDLVGGLLNRATLKDAGYFDSVRVGRLVDKCRAGRAIGFADNMAFVGILSTMLIHELFISRSG